MIPRTTLIAVLILAAGPAPAACPAAPDTAASNYVEQGVARSLCLQQELATDAATRGKTRQFEMQLNNLELQRQLDRLRTLPRHDFLRQ